MSLPYEARTAQYYDSIAAVYDSQVDSVEGNRFVRSQFVERVSSLVRPGERIVDFGCGTGADVDWYAERGYHVVAYDISTGMTDLLRERCDEHIKSGRVAVVTGAADRLWDVLDHTGPARTVVANFAVFNHIRDLGALFHAVAAHLEPRGMVVTLMLNPFYWRDIGQPWWWRCAATSLGSGGLVFNGPDITTYRHFPWSVVRAASSEFTVVERFGCASGPSRVGALASLGAVASQFSIFVFQRRE